MTFASRRNKSGSKPSASALPSHSPSMGARTPSPTFPSAPALYSDQDFSARDAGKQRVFGSNKQRNDAPPINNGLGLGIGMTSSPQPTGSTGLSRLLSFARKGDKGKEHGNYKKDPTPRIISPSTMFSTQSLPMGFPEPPYSVSTFSPQLAQPLRSAPKQHATHFIAPHTVDRPVANSDSMSTFASTSSFASTRIFTEDSESGSEATSASLTSSPETTGSHSRMWKVKGAGESPLQRDITNVTNRPRQRSHDSNAEETLSIRSRNSTPIPSIVAAMLRNPETPPRSKRFSTSTVKPPADSPPFNLEYERAQRQQHGTPGSSEDADDEISPPKPRMLVPPNDKDSRARIPSIRFEGISMDAVFAEVERKMKIGDSSSSLASDSEKRARRRTRILSLYPGDQAISLIAPVEPVVEVSSSPAVKDSDNAQPSSSGSESSLAGSETRARRANNVKPLDRPLPRRVSSRPRPVDVDAANALADARKSSVDDTSPRSVDSNTTITSPSSDRSWTASPTPMSPVEIASPRLPVSPAATLSPHSPLMSPSPSVLGEAFVPSPALSTTSTFRGVELPEVCVRPPTPTADDGDWVPPPPVQMAIAPVKAKVVVLEEKRIVKLSSRAPSRGQRRTFVPVESITPPVSPSMLTHTPPLSPTLSQTSSNGVDTPDSAVFGLGLSNASPSSTSKRCSTASKISVSSDATDAEDAIDNMLFRLNQPHTPPSSPQHVRITAPDARWSPGSLPPIVEIDSPESSLNHRMTAFDEPSALVETAPLRLSNLRQEDFDLRPASPASSESTYGLPYDRDESMTFDEFIDNPPARVEDKVHEPTVVVGEGVQTLNFDETFDRGESHQVEIIREFDEDEHDEGNASSVLPSGKSMPTHSSSSSLSSIATNSTALSSTDSDASEVGVVMMGERVAVEHMVGIAM